MVHRSCVQIAVRAEKASVAVRATSRAPDNVLTSAALPTADSAVVEVTSIVTTPAETAADKRGNSGADEGDIGFFEHASSTAPTVTSERA